METALQSNKAGDSMNHSIVTGNLIAHNIGISSQRLADRPRAQAAMRRTPNRASLVRARAFSRMSNEQQRNFLAQRFQVVDPQELITIVKSIYGRPADKGRPRRK